MRIGFSARGLSIPSGGVRQFITSVVPALAKNIGDDELVIFYNDERFKGLAPACTEIVTPGRNRIWWDFVKLPAEMRRRHIDVMIFPKNVIPFFTGARNFVVIHDLAYFDRKLNAYPPADTLYMKLLIPQSVKRADGIFAVSEHTKKDIIRLTGCAPEKIYVTYEAADEMYRPITDKVLLQVVVKKYSLPEKFILYVGSLSPRKNIKTLLRAFALIKDKIPHNLVITASKSWNDKSVYRLVTELGLESRITKLGYVEHKDMPALYNLADVYVYPSLYEGFGLPVLEAMQCGCPVIASNATSIPEVAGDAARIIGPFEKRGWSEAILNVILNRDARENLVIRGFSQAEKFSWGLCARGMLGAIRNCFKDE